MAGERITYSAANEAQPHKKITRAPVRAFYWMAEKSSWITIPLGVVGIGAGAILASPALIGISAGGIALDVEGNKYWRQSREAEQRKAGIQPEVKKRKGPFEIFNFRKHKN